AYTLGGDSHVVVASNMAVEHLELDELQFVLGHELGHVKAGHVRYHYAAQLIKKGASIASSLTFGLGGLATRAPLGTTLFAWSAGWEFPAARAGLLARQDRGAALRAMMKLAGFPPKFIQEMKPDEYLAQAARHQQALDDSFLDRMKDLGEHLELTHPL